MRKQFGAFENVLCVEANKKRSAMKRVLVSKLVDKKTKQNKGFNRRARLSAAPTTPTPATHNRQINQLR